MDLQQLNLQQRRSVENISDPLLVLAGAGSGKTRVITQKIAYLIRKCDMPAHHIRAVTFTNKAAAEMKQRVAKSVEKSFTRGLKITTFHQLGLEIIRKESRSMGYKSNFSIFDDIDTKQVLKEVMLENNADASLLDMVRHKISLWKNALTSPSQALSLATTDADTHAAICYQSYQKLLRAYNAVDFDDLIVKPYHHLLNCQETLERWQNRIHYMLVDEYQDTNVCQYELLKLLVGVRARFTVVGDDDQSIYGWRGAEPENLSTLAKDYPTLEVIKLEQNYRSTQNILKAANAVIAHNAHMFEKRIWSELGHGPLIRIQYCENDEDETEWIANNLLHHKLQSAACFSHFAVLFRSNYQSRLLEIKLQSLNIPYKMNGGTSFFARSEVKDVLAYLRLILNPSDDNAFLRVINTPRREIGVATLEKLGGYASSRDISLYDAISELGLEQTLSGKGLQNLQRFKKWLDAISSACYSAEDVTPIEQLLKDIDYEQWLFEQSASAKIAERRWENVLQLLTSIEHMMSDADPEKVRSNESLLEAVLNRLIIRDIIDQQTEEAVGERVQLMTLHAAKGLEFPFVYLMGMEENLLPHRSSVEEGSIEEERRLFYVGITRAQHQLILTLCAEHKNFGEKVEVEPSRFLDELPTDIIERSGKGVKIEPEKQKEIGQSYISSLKSMLAGE